MALLHAHDPGAVRHFMRFALPVSFCGLVIVFPFLRQEEHTLICSSVGNTIVCGASSALLWYLITNQGSVIARAFSLKWVRFFGTISYSLYLYHCLIMRLSIDFFRRHGINHDGIASLVVFPICILVSAASFFWVEQYFIALAKRKVIAWKAGFVASV